MNAENSPAHAACNAKEKHHGVAVSEECAKPDGLALWLCNRKSKT